MGDFEAGPARAGSDHVFTRSRDRLGERFSDGAGGPGFTRVEVEVDVPELRRPKAPSLKAGDAARPSCRVRTR